MSLYLECPQCEQSYAGLQIKSNRSMELSNISCSECTFLYQKGVDEEDVEIMFRQDYNGIRITKLKAKITQLESQLSNYRIPK